MTSRPARGGALTLSLTVALLCGAAASAQDASVNDTQGVDDPASSSDWRQRPGGEYAPSRVPRVDAISPTDPAALEAAIDRGVRFLVADQNRTGSWGSFTNTGLPPMYDPLPGSKEAFRGATTALCVSALIELEEDGGLEDRAGGATAALDAGEAWLLDTLPKVKRTTPDVLYNVWTHIYATQAFVRMHRRHAGDATRQAMIRAAAEAQIGLVTRFESVDGGWGYYDFRAETARPATDSISFTNAAALVALKEAQDAGFTVNVPVIRRAQDATLRQRKNDFSYLYGEYLRNSPMSGINRPGGSLGRSQACNIALRMWGDDRVTDTVLKDWLHRLFARNGWLDIGRKRPIPHESWFAVAGYFYYFGHYYAALCIEDLPDEDQQLFKDHMAATLLPIQEANGSWWDYPMYDFHEPYGTAFALMTLRRCRPPGQ